MVYATNLELFRCGFVRNMEWVLMVAQNHMVRILVGSQLSLVRIFESSQFYQGNILDYIQLDLGRHRSHHHLVMEHICYCTSQGCMVDHYLDLQWHHMDFRADLELICIFNLIRLEPNWQCFW